MVIAARRLKMAARILEPVRGERQAEAPVDDHQKMRVSDADREETVGRLRVALDEGRLKMDEYLHRMEQAYDAVTYADLAGLCDDLPVARRDRVSPASAAQPATPPRQPAPVRPDQAAPMPTGFFARLPGLLKLLWTIWLVAVSVNVVVWVLVMGTTGHLIYPWPIWVAGPYGAVLLAISASAEANRRGRGHPPLPPGSRP